MKGVEVRDSSKALLEGNVNQQKKDAEGGVKTAEKEPPKETGEAKVEKPIPPEGAPTAPAVNAAEGMPAPKPDADVSLQDSKQDTESQMKEAEVTPQQLRKANDPRFSAVLTAKDAVAKQADAAPSTYRAGEKGVLAVAASAAQGQGAKGAAAMVGVRGRSNSAVLSKQALAKQKEEQERKAVTDHIEQIYTKTKEKVEQKLSSLETEVGSLFDAGVDAAVNGMTGYVNQRMDRYKDERYSGLIGKGRWLKDKLLGLPSEADVFYVEGRKLFTRLMDALVVRVAALVETRLKEAKDEVAKGQAEIKAYVQGLSRLICDRLATRLPRRSRAVSPNSHKASTPKKNELAQQLAQKYKESFDKANEALKKIQDANKGLVTAFVEKLGEIIKILREFKDKLMALLKKAADVIGQIVADPIGFLGNLIAAIKLGISQFVSNIWTHLKKGFMTWLFGSLAEAGIEIPSDLTLPSILKMVLAVLGITYDRMRAKAVKLIGERAVKVIEKVADYVKALIQGGPAKLWEMVKEDLSNLKEMVIGALQDWLITTIVKKATVKLISMFNPAGAIIQAILLIYDTVTFLIENASRIMAFVEAVIDSVAAIAAGAIGGAANWIEQALGRMVPILIGFLAQLLGLGGISKKIKEFITKVQNFVDKAIDKAIAKVVGIVKKLFGKLTGKDKDKKDEKDDRTDEQKNADLHQALAEARKLAVPGVTRDEIDKKLPAIAKRFRLKSLTTVDHGQDTYRIHGEVNPTEDSDDLPKVLSVAKAVVELRRALASKKTNVEVSVASEADAREVIAQALPGATEHPSPTPGSAYGSKVDQGNLEAFRQFRKKALGFHVDVQSYNVGEIRGRLLEEIAQVTASRDHAQTEIQYHKDNPAWSARNQSAMRESERNLNASKERLANLTDIKSNLAANEAQWKALEKEGVLYGHATVDKDESKHRTNPHVNVEGATEVQTRTSKFPLFVKIAIYVRAK